MSTIFWWIVGIVAATVLFAGVASAASLSGTLMGTVGGTAGAIVSGVPNMVTSFREGMAAGDKPGQKSSLFEQQPRRGQGAAPARDRQPKRSAPTADRQAR